MDSISPERGGELLEEKGAAQIQRHEESATEAQSSWPQRHGATEEFRGRTSVPLWLSFRDSQAASSRAAVC
jgi:hypothetical protein